MVALFAIWLTTITPGLCMPLAMGVVVFVVLLLLGKVPLGYNIRNLAVRWRTTLLTALAFTLVVGLMVVMLAFVNGMKQLTEQSGQPGNVIVLSDGVTDELVSNLGYNDSSDVALQRGVLRDERNRPLASREVYVVVNQPISSKAPVASQSQSSGAHVVPGEKAREAMAQVGESGKGKRRFVQVRGLEDPPMEAKAHGIELFAGGRRIVESGVRRL